MPSRHEVEVRKLVSAMLPRRIHGEIGEVEVEVEDFVGARS